MARVCTMCGKGPTTGNHVSHANNRRKRRWFPNLQTVRVLVEGAAPPGPGLHPVHQEWQGRQGQLNRPDRAGR